MGWWSRPVLGFSLGYAEQLSEFLVSGGGASSFVFLGHWAKYLLTCIGLTVMLVMQCIGDMSVLIAM